MLWTKNRHRRFLAFTATSVLTIVLPFSSTKHFKFIISATDVSNMTQLPNWLISFHFEITKFLFLILDSCFLRLRRGNIAVLSLSREAVHSPFSGSLGLVKLKSIHFLLSGSLSDSSMFDEEYSRAPLSQLWLVGGRKWESLKLEVGADSCLELFQWSSFIILRKLGTGWKRFDLIASPFVKVHQGLCWPNLQR